MDYDSSWNPYLQNPAIDGKVIFERELNLIKNQEVMMLICILKCAI